MSAPAAGTRLGGRYRLVRQIAVGGMGEVWVAHDESLARDVAVKVLRPEFAGNAEFLTRLRTEARNAASLSHSNIAQLYDYGEQQGLGFLVMELVHGEPMSDLLERSPVLPVDRLLAILSQTARGLHAAHVSGVVHRDVKPGNLLLERSGNVKITDFGVSLAANQIPMTATGMVMGTAQYLSPEQAIGRAATPSSDIYSLGVIAFEALVGHRPFTGKTPVDIAVAHVNEPIPALPASVPPVLAELVVRMLAKEPSERPRSGAQLGRTLDQLALDFRNSPWLGSVGAPREQPTERRSGGIPLTPRTPISSDRVAPGSGASGPMRPRTTPPGSPAAPQRLAASGARPQAPHSNARSAPSPAARRVPVRPRRASTTTGQRVGRWSWQSVVLVVLIAAVVIGAIVGLFTRDGDADKTRGLHAATPTVSLVANHAREWPSEKPRGFLALPPVEQKLGTDPTTPKDV